MKITEFGKIVRKARLDVEVSLLSMAKELQVTSSFLSGMETGRKKITVDCVQKTKAFFEARGVTLNNLEEAADVSNKSVSLEGLSPAHQMIIAGFARATISDSDMENLKNLLTAVNTKKGEK